MLLQFFFLFSSKPMVCLFPVTLKQNLLSLIHLVHSTLPRTGVLHLLECLCQEPRPNPWVITLVRQLQRDLGNSGEGPLFTLQCGQRLKGLCEGLGGPGRTGGWVTYFNGQIAVPASQAGLELSEPGTQRKRKSSSVALDSDAEDNGQQSKRIKMNLSPAMNMCSSEGPALETQCLRGDSSGGVEEVTAGATVEPQQPAAASLCDTLPEQIKVDKQPTPKHIHSPWAL